MTYFTPAELLLRLRGKNESGLYYIRVKSEDDIRSLSKELYNEFIRRGNCLNPSPEPLVVYIGKANGRRGLYQRLNQELLHVGAGTFFRGLGAIMGKNPKRATTHSGVKNYCFAEKEKNEIIRFIKCNTEIAIELLTDKTIETEKRMISKYKPLFNTTHNPCPSQFVRKSRARCRSYAAEFLNEK